MSPILYWTLLTLTCGYAIYRGGRYERVVAAVCIIGTIATVAVNSPLNRLYMHVEGGALLVDIGVLAAFVAVALQSDRFWPLWVAGLQLTTSVAHFLKAIDPHLIPQAYGLAVRFWSYPILIILAVGAWRTHRRTRMQERLATT
jgi:energy-converting hydrogenase Eha subunit C